MNQERYDEARVLAQALQHGLQEVRDDVSTLVAAEVQRAGLSAEETERLIRGFVRDELDRRAQNAGRPWVAAAVSGFIAGIVAAAATMLLAGAAFF